MPDELNIDNINYIQWNNILSQYFFNVDKSEKEVFLFITKSDIVKLGRDYGLIGTDDEVFESYIYSFYPDKFGISGGFILNEYSNILDRATFVYNFWKRFQEKIDDKKVFPFYISYLVLFVLPLTEKQNINVRSNAYYPRINNFLESYNLPLLPNQNKEHNWNLIWEDLQNWSWFEKNTELGYFELHPFSNKHWIYVGKPLSQSIFPIYAIKNLPRFFGDNGLIPHDDIEGIDFRKILLKHGQHALKLSEESIQYLKDSRNELGQSIINIVKKNYLEWDGNTDYYDSEVDISHRGYTITRLNLCIEGDIVRGFKYYFRLFTNLDYPDDLVFSNDENNIECSPYYKGWSKPMFMTFDNRIELNDHSNKWKAIFKLKEIQLFKRGINQNLSGWIATNNLLSSKMLLLVNKSALSSIEQWGENFIEGDFKRIFSASLPDDYYLYEISNPPLNHPEIPILQFRTNKKVSLINGLKVRTNTFLIKPLPEIYIDQGNGNEKVILEYEDSGKSISLERKNVDDPIWLLPHDVLINKKFSIKVEGEKIRGDELKHIIIEYCSINEFKSMDIPSRDKFGEIIIDNQFTSTSIIGNKLITYSREEERKYDLQAEKYKHKFGPQEKNGELAETDYPVDNLMNEVLASFIVEKGEMTVKDYFEAFELIYYNSFTPEEIQEHTESLSMIKNKSLRYLDYLGFLDIEYRKKGSNKIRINSPQLINIPTKNGRCLLLIGGRNIALINNLWEKCIKIGLQFNIHQQNSSLSCYLLPPAITITGFSNSLFEIESKFELIASTLSIEYNKNNFPQLNLTEFSGSINEYEEQIEIQERFSYMGAKIKVFDPEKLKYTIGKNTEIDKTLNLVEYSMNEYTFYNILWRNNIPYYIDRNWGRYLILNKFNKKIIFSDSEKNIIAIPSSVPLPILLYKAMVLCSGKIPQVLFKKIDDYETFFSMFENVPSIFGHNIFLKKLNQKPIEVNL